MAAVRNGPTHPYAAEYVRLNNRIDRLVAALASEFGQRGFSARPLLSSERTDRVRIAGDFPHKTVATRAGLGWIGRNCQLVTRTHGPWIRLGSVFTDMQLPCGTPVEQGSCGGCTRCVDACPSGALKGAVWRAGLPREAMLDVAVCDGWKKQHYVQYEEGHVCGICSASCPFGLKTLRPTPHGPSAADALS
jgi:epoxyqueuosine reductase QueG